MMNTMLRNIIDRISLTVNWDEVWKIPEFAILKTTKQNPYWHMEGVVSEHTKKVVEAIYELCPLEDGDILSSVGDASQRYMKRYILVLSALFHDIGKGVTTKWSKEAQTWKAPYHAKASEQITRKLLWDMYFPHRELICSLVGNHMKPLYVCEKKDKVKEVITLADECASLEWLLTLKTADCTGALMQEYDGWKEKLEEVKNIAIENDCLLKSYTFKNTASKYAYFNDDSMTDPSAFIEDDRKFSVYLLIGIPGSGKTTFREKLSCPVVCRDDIRTEIGISGEKPMGNTEQEDEVTRIQNERIIKYAEQKQSFVIDATNLKRKYRDGFKNILKPYNPKFIYHYFEAPSLQDNLNRRKGQIPENVILRMRDNFEFPKMTECEELIVHKQGLDFFKGF